MLVPRTKMKGAGPEEYRPRWPAAGLLVATFVAAIGIGAVLLPSGGGPMSMGPVAPGAADTHSGAVAAPVTLSVPASPGPSGTWGWGVRANLSATLDFVGAYNASQNLSGGNLTVSGASVAVHESFGIGYAAFAVVNLTSPSPGHLALHLQAAQLQVLQLAVAASGTFPVAGNYSANQSVPLAPMNASLFARLATLSVYDARLNLTSGPNGSIVLNNEQLAEYEAVNVSLIASNFPNVSRSASGWSVHYTTGWIQADGVASARLAANFTPGIPIVVAPLYVGKNWTATTTASFVGSWGYSTRISAGIPHGPSFSQSRSASASLNVSGPLNFAFAVTGTKTIYQPDGTASTGYVLSVSSGGGSSSVVVVDGVLVLPTADPTHAAGVGPSVSERPAAAALARSPATTSRAIVTPAHPVATSVQATPAGDPGVTAAPMTPSQATRGIDSLRAPGTQLSAGPAPPLGALAGAFLGLVTLAVLAGILVWRVERRRLRELR